MDPKPTIQQLTRAAKLAAEANSRGRELTQKWVDLFERRFGHTDISDSLVEIIDYSTGNLDCITPKFIEDNSAPDQS